MREMATKEAVWVAAASLDATGVTPNVVLIRERVGGSFSTIQKHLRSWQADRAAAQAVAVPAEIDDQVVQLATQLSRDLWRAATQHSAADIAQVRQQARAEMTAVEAERDQAYGAISRLEQEAEEYITKLSDAQREIEVLREELATARAQTQIEQGRASEMERQLQAARAELEQARQQASAQLAESVAAIQQQLTQQAAQLQRLTQGQDEETSHP